jgi:predicted N-formylglutamate amidohydrolase
LSKLIFTCEHGGNLIPDQYQKIFKDYQEILKTHRGYDPGALNLAQHLGKTLKAPLFYSVISRLLVELNRSLHHPDLFSPMTKALSDAGKKNIIENYYLPYRLEVENKISEFISKPEEVLHISVHSFTPVLNGQERNCDIGLLYDPKKKAESNFCKAWKLKIVKEKPPLKTRFNYPYKGISDGFTTYLRKKFTENYIGLELEVNQKILLDSQEEVNQIISNSLLNVLHL